MQILWKVSQEDVDKVKSFVSQHENNFFVQTRIRRNVNGQREPVLIDAFWEHHVACLATTQQRSGPGSNVNTFVNSRSFILNYSACIEKGDSLETDAQQELSNFRLRRSNTIAKEISQNIKFICKHWSEIKHSLDQIGLDAYVESERKAANNIQANLRGFGPKQSRNLLQSLGITRFEIPIDSRITKWLNKFGFPVRLTAATLADSNY